MPPFTKLLIANRGEIAVRVIRACRDLGIGTVAIYTDADREARHVHLAHEAYALGSGSLAETYLGAHRILEIARRSGAEAIHPGYGFLSENAPFAAACTEAGLVFVGPTSEVISRMGSKVVARQTMHAAGVPVVPGTFTAVQDAADIMAFGAQHGFPVALKASAGGGGKGFRVVTSPAEVDKALETARREGESYFGDGTVYMEKYLTAPRHIEVQVLGDHHGHVVHLGERDCSLQRRHQKVFEESPAPHLPAALREQLLAAAVKGAHAIGYRGAGTFEFIVQDDDFYFLEANTRLQVEHGVTELVTGVDIVAWMIRIAAGEALPFTQGDVTFRGHAIECRVNAEAVDKDFAPAPGLLSGYQEPSGPWVRVDAAAYAGWQIPSLYDSLVAKLLVWGTDRADCLSRLARALDEYVIEGVPTTIALHRWLTSHPAIREGRYDTGFLSKHFDAAVLPVSAAASPGAGGGSRRSLQVEVNQRLFTVTVIEPEVVTSVPVGAGRPQRHGGGGNAQAAGDGTLAAPLSGTVVKVAVAVGDTVSAGDMAVVIEAMKMENDIAAPQSGRISAVHVKAGDPVNAGAPLLTLE